MEFLKKHWQKIVIIIFVIMYFSTCINNCSNKNTIRTMKATYTLSDSIISSLNDTVKYYKDEIKELNRDIKELESKNDMLRNSNDDLNKALNRKVVVNITNASNEKE